MRDSEQPSRPVPSKRIMTLLEEILPPHLCPHRGLHWRRRLLLHLGSRSLSRHNSPCKHNSNLNNNNNNNNNRAVDSPLSTPRSSRAEDSPLSTLRSSSSSSSSHPLDLAGRLGLPASHRPISLRADSSRRAGVGMAPIANSHMTAPRAALSGVPL